MPIDLLTETDDRPDRTALARVRGWVRELAHLGDGDGVMVSELACSEPGCPPLETVIVIAPAGGATHQHKLHAAAHEVRREDLQDLFSRKDVDGDRDC